jgi:hypothetical protein
MTDYERFLTERRQDPPRRRQHDHDKDRGAMVRTILQGLILAGIIGLVGMVIQNGRDSSQADRDRSVQIATLQSQVASLQTLLAGLPEMNQRVTRLEANQAELIRRQGGDDERWERLGSTKLKGWVR